MTHEQHYRIVQLCFTLYVLKLIDREHTDAAVNDKVADYFSYMLRDTFV